MTMHDERWTLGVAENGDVRLCDLQTGETSRFGGHRGLFEALGKLADWREGDAFGKPKIDHAFRSLNGDDKCAAIVGQLSEKIGCGRPASEHMSHYGVPCCLQPDRTAPNGVCPCVNCTLVRPETQQNADDGASRIRGSVEVREATMAILAEQQNATDVVSENAGVETTPERNEQAVRYNALYFQVADDPRDWWTAEEVDSFIAAWDRLELPKLTVQDATGERLTLWCSDVDRAAEMLGMEVGPHYGARGFEICKGEYSVGVVQAEDKETKHA